MHMLKGCEIEIEWVSETDLLLARMGRRNVLYVGLFGWFSLIYRFIWGFGDKAIKRMVNWFMICTSEPWLKNLFSPPYHTSSVFSSPYHRVVVMIMTIMTSRKVTLKVNGLYDIFMLDVRAHVKYWLHNLLVLLIAVGFAWTEGISNGLHIAFTTIGKKSRSFTWTYETFVFAWFICIKF